VTLLGSIVTLTKPTGPTDRLISAFETRLAAIDALGRADPEGRGASQAALKPLASDPDPRVRYRVARALRRLGS
jgi:HEAT repeat protein